MEEKKYGVIHEVGDLGLGFNELNEEDNAVINEQQKKESKKEEN